MIAATKFVRLFFFVVMVIVFSGFGEVGIKIEGGTFSLGSFSGPADEVPASKVTISPFIIDAHEVSLGSYDSCVNNGICTPPHYSDGKCLMLSSGTYKSVVVPEMYRLKKYPVTCVSWEQAKTFCSYRKGSLPTEAQWEYAALGGRNTTYS
jgi:sulfatase modifying factor 1